MILKSNKIKVFLLFPACFFIITLLFSSFSIANSYKIEPPSEKQLSILKVLLNQDVIIEKSAAIKSQHHKKVYYLGLKFTITGIKKPQIGVWVLLGNKSNPVGVLAVDGFAKNFSRATHADKTNPPTAYSYDPECKILIQHLR